MTIVVDWDIKLRINQTNKHSSLLISLLQHARLAYFNSDKNRTEQKQKLGHDLYNLSSLPLLSCQRNK